MRIKRPKPFTRCTDNMTGTPVQGTPGTNFSFGAANADGAAVEVLGNLTHDAHYLVVGIGGGRVSTEDSSALLDVLIDRSGGTTWGSFIDDLVCGFQSTPSPSSPIGCWYHFPIWIPSGSSLAVQARRTGATASADGRVVMYAIEWPDIPWHGQAVESLGINAAASKGFSHTPGGSGSYSAFATAGTSTRRYGAIQLGLNGDEDAVTAIAAYYWQLGVGGAQMPGTPTLYHTSSSVEIFGHAGQCMPIFCDVAAGTEIQVRATSDIAGPSSHSVGVYGVY